MEDRLIIVGLVFGWLFITLLVGWIASSIEGYDDKEERK